MWLLITSTGKRIYLKLNVPVSIGRKNSDILLAYDASVSKTHASILVKPLGNITVGKSTSSCILKDEGSKYGTYISKNGKFEKVVTDIFLKDQDVIRIGLQKEIFTVKYIPIISMTSALQVNEKEKLLEIMSVIGGIITSEWNPYCTHLTVVKPKLTQKVAVSLAACIPIVSIDYWDAVKSTIEEGDPFPKTNNFTPKINEQYISKISTSLVPNNERKTLFTNMTFNFFCTQQYNLYKTMIQLAGGTSILFNPNNENNSTFEDNIIFVHYSVIDNTQLAEDCIEGYDHICKKLDACKRRTIPESEIPLAILHCSIEQYCNSKFNFGNCLKRREKPNYNLPETLVVDTQDQDISTIEDVSGKQKSCYNKHTNYVPETLVNDDISEQDDAISEESLHGSKELTPQRDKFLLSSKELTPQRERTTSKKFFIPETMESSISSQRNTDYHIKQNSNYNPFKTNIDNNLKKASTSVNPIFRTKQTTTLSDEYNNEQIETPCTKELPSLKKQICIPETIDDNYFDSSEICNNIPNKIKDSSKEKDSDVITVTKEVRKGDKDTLVTAKDKLTAELTTNSQSHMIEKEIEKDETWTSTCPSNSKIIDEIDNEKYYGISYIHLRKTRPGKTFKKAYVKIPEKRRRLMELAEEN